MATTSIERDPPLTHLLKSYTSSHPLRSPSPLPAGSRVDPRLAQRAAPTSASSPLLWTLSTWIAFVQFAFAKGLHIIWSLIKHLLFGPQRKSWGYRMTFITSFMRNVANYTDFADIMLIRRLVSITYLIPLPADAVVTPITFLVPKRTGPDACRGFLHEWDLTETGTRELTGEWVVGNDVWKRLKAERRAKWHGEMRKRAPPGPSRLGRGSVAGSSTAGSPVQARSVLGAASGSGRVAAEDLEPETEDVVASPTNKRERVIYYVHGGAYYVGNAATHRLVTIGVSKACNARVFAITYRLAPESAFPLPLHDVLHGYLRLLAPPLSIPPENIVIAGDSAGGGLSLALCMYLRDNGYQLPSGLVLMSPWVDLTMSCGSWDECADSDVVPCPETDDHLNPVGCYLGPKNLATYVTHPYASPLFGDLRDLPPMLIQSGDSEVLRDEITLLAHKATLAGVSVTHELYEDMVHVFQTFTWLPAAQAAVASVGRWVRQTLPRIEWEARQAAAGTHLTGGLQLEGMDGSPAPPPSEALLSVEGFGPGSAQRTPRLGTHAPRAPSIDTDSLPASTPSGTPSRTPNIGVIPASTSPGQRAYSSHAALEALAAEHRHGDADGDHTPGDHTPRASASNTSASPEERLSARPRLRHAHTSGGSRSRSTHSTHLSPVTPPMTPLSAPGTSPRASLRRRRQAAAMHISTTTPGSPSNGGLRTGSSTSTPYPSSPTPSMRSSRSTKSTFATLGSYTRLRAALPGSTSHPTTPSARARSQSHLDIAQLMEGYFEGGAANATVVYGAGGEIRSVGVLGDEDEEMDEWEQR